MIKIIKYLKTHLSEDFSLRLYGVNAVFLAVCITINYIYDFEDSVIDSYSGREIRILWYILFFGLAYYFSCASHLIVGRGGFIRQRSFWIKSLLLVSLLAFDSSFYYHRAFIQEHFSVEQRYFLIKLSGNLVSVLTIILPLFLFYRWYERDKSRFYGFAWRGVDLSPYWTILLILIPLVLIASFDASFLRQYPSIRDTAVASYMGWPSWLPYALFELAYGSDFISVELVFRGFLVIGMMQIMGRSAVLPMVVLYAFYHFGKPAGEAISSIFGGYILGVIAFQTRSIFGGIIVHVGLAWMMELFAFLQKLIR